jgi:SsrA-binding protein
MGTVSAKKAILIPLKLFEKKGKIKLEIGMGISKKKSDKREVIKKRETKREIDRKIKG